MKKKLPLYKMEISSEEDGVFAISVVDAPAIESNFMLFNKEEEQIIFKTQIEQQVVTGPALIPDKLIYRRNTNGEEYNITMSSDVIKQTAIKFFKDNFQNSTTLDHETEVNGTTYFESWIIEDPKNDKSNALGFKDLPQGTWMVSMKVQDPELWSEIKNGNFNGFSIEGYYDKVLVDQKKQNEENIMDKLIERLKKALLSIDTVEVKFMDAKLDDGTLIRIDDESKEVMVINTDGSLSPLPDGDYILEDGSPLSVMDGKMVEAPAEEAPAEEAPVEEEVAKVEAEIVDLVLEDGTEISVDMDSMIVTNKADGTPLADGHYKLDSGEEFDVVDGLIKIEKPAPGDELSRQIAIVKLGLTKKDLTVEFEKLVEELTLRIQSLENKPAVERTETLARVKVEEMTVAERIVYNIRKGL